LKDKKQKAALPLFVFYKLGFIALMAVSA